MGWRGFGAAAIASLGIVAGGCGRIPLLPAEQTPAPVGDASADAADAGTSSHDSGRDARDARPDAADLGPAAIDTSAPKDATPEDGDVAGDVPACEIPLAPVLSVIADDEVLTFVSPTGGRIETATLPADAPPSTTSFHPGSGVTLTGLSGPTRVLARTMAPGCEAVLFDEVYDVRDTYSPPPPDDRTTAVAHDDPRILGWAQGSTDYAPGANVTETKWMMPNKALGPVGTDNLEVVVLGVGGRITLTFGRPIADGAGWDFAIFENGFANDQFLELAFVEVSSDGIHFVRFDSAFRGPLMPCASCSGQASGIGGLAGTYRFGFGTPFDLAALRSAPLVRDGTVDLASVRYVRVIDIFGDGATLDSFGRGIIDPLLGGPTAGFDLDAVAVLNQGP
jgi:hypothetical protein